MNPPGPGFADAARDLPSVKNGMAECEAGARVLKPVTGMNPFSIFRKNTARSRQNPAAYRA